MTDVAQAGSAIYHKINWRETALAMGFAQSEWPEFRLQIDPNDFMAASASTFPPRRAQPDPLQLVFFCSVFVTDSEHSICL